MKKLFISIIAFGFILVSSCVESNSITSATNVDNLYFFKNNISHISYQGTFLFAANSEEIAKKEVKLYINKVGNLKRGKLYNLKINSVKNIPSDRLNLGYFYVQKDKIYRFSLTRESLNKFKVSEKVPSGSSIICSNKQIKDALGENKRGWHQYLKLNGSKIEYHSYNNLVETGFYEDFTWEKNVGLVNYRSGFGAERDGIELQIINQKGEQK